MKKLFQNKKLCFVLIMILIVIIFTFYTLIPIYRDARIFNIIADDWKWDSSTPGYDASIDSINLVFDFALKKIALFMFFIFSATFLILKALENFKSSDDSEIPVIPDDKELLEKAKEIITVYDFISATVLQREFKIGYAHSARLLDMLERDGYVGPANGAKPRKVLIKE